MMQQMWMILVQARTDNTCPEVVASNQCKLVVVAFETEAGGVRWTPSVPS